MEKANFKKGQKVIVISARNGARRDATVVGMVESNRGDFVQVNYVGGGEGRLRPSQLTAK